jgi:hypothetical protein
MMRQTCCLVNNKNEGGGPNLLFEGFQSLLGFAQAVAVLGVAARAQAVIGDCGYPRDFPAAFAAECSGIYPSSGNPIELIIQNPVVLLEIVHLNPPAVLLCPCREHRPLIPI